MALFGELARLAEVLVSEPGRLKKRAAIAAALGVIAGTPASQNRDMGHPASVASTPTSQNRDVGHTGVAVEEHALRQAGLFCLYLAGQPFAEADPRKLNAGGALLSRAVLKACGATEAQLSVAYRRHGDLGAAAEELWRAYAGPELTLDEVSAAFDQLAAARTTAGRAAIVLELLQRAAPVEAKYLLKLMLGDMRIGVKQSLIEEAIAVAASSEQEKVSAAEVRHAVMLEADLGRAVVMAFTHTLDEARMRLFHPLGFMLASPVETPEEAVARFTEKPLEGAEASAPEAFLEDKFDGMRAQLHCGDAGQPGRVVLYSRNREDITESFPELVEAFAGATTAAIVDGEILGWDVAAGKALPFAVLGQRIGRKRVDDAIRRQIPVIFMAFDLLFEHGELLLDRPLRERRQRLEALVSAWAPRAVASLAAPDLKAQQSLFAPVVVAQEMVPRLWLSPAVLVESAEAIEQAYVDARARANEGVMLKAAGSVYQPGRRGLSWVKLKRELATLDVVITGAEFGHGRRAGLLSDYTFAVRSADGELLNVGKAYSGMTDAEIAEMTEWLKAHTLEDQGHFRTVEPLRILEVAFNNVMRSTRHASGFALRFPRILRIRDDKPLEEIDTLERVEAIYQSQPDRPVEG